MAQPPSNSLRTHLPGQPSAGPMDEDDGFTVELPDVFERPKNPAGQIPQAVSTQPAYSQSPVGEHTTRPAAVIEKSGLSAAGAFFLALFAQVLLVAVVLALGYAFPLQSSDLLSKAISHLESGGEETIPVEPFEGPNLDDMADRLSVLELEDRAIYRGDRTALSELQRQATNLDSADPIFDAVQASLVRIKRVYQANVDPPAPFNANVMIPGTTSDNDLPEVAVIQVLRDPRQAPEARQRAAYLLGQIKASTAQKALYNAVIDDPNLEVVYQSFRAFRESTGYPGTDFVDVDAMKDWWYQNASTILGQN